MRKEKKIFGAIFRTSPVDFPREWPRILTAVNRLLIFLLLLVSTSAFASAQEKKRFVLYGILLENIPVQLADGSKWEMDKGDTFPVVMYKEQRTKMILQLAGTSFLIAADKVKVIEEKELTEALLATYRNNVANYLESRAKKMRAEMAK